MKWFREQKMRKINGKKNTKILKLSLKNKLKIIGNKFQN